MCDPNVRWLVTARGNQETVRNYLYSFAHVVGVTYANFNDLCLIVVVGRPGHDEVYGRAQQQADRLSSGLLAPAMFDTYAQAYQRVESLV